MSRKTLVLAAAKALVDPDWRVAATACAEIGTHRLTEVLPRVSGLLAQKAHDDPRIEHLLRTLGLLGAKAQAQLVRPYLRHPRPTVRMEALRALAPDRLGGPGTVPWIAAAMHQDKDSRIRRGAAEVLAQFEDRTARTLVAERAGRLDLLADLGATEPLLRRLQDAGPLEQVESLRLVGRSRASNRALMIAVLQEPLLAHLHGLAFEQLRDRGDRPQETEQIRRQLQEQWGAKIAEQRARCSTDEWYAAFTQLKRWHSDLPFRFLEAEVTQGLALCRAVALERLSANQH